MTEAHNPRYHFKIIIVGKFGVGKSTLLNTYINGTFNKHLAKNVCTDKHEIRILRNNATVKLKIFDTAGQERYRSLTGSYFRDSDGVILAYDVTDEASFSEIDSWVEKVNWFRQSKFDYPSRDATQMLVALKCHVTTQRVISENTGRARASALNMSYMEVCSETGYNVPELFETLVDEMVEQYTSKHTLVSDDIDNVSGKLVRFQDGSDKNGCC